MASGIARSLGRIFFVHRKPGRFSPKSLMLFPKRGPKFSTLTPQQKKISEAGKSCAQKMRDAGTATARRTAAGDCIRAYFKK